ncbi:hypothetical protein JOF56_010095 [Kibdelosporangium banguiense]|uniref:Uncharacterized protein n=1 Tax=Kibdelosporangium banguiense TaxID=1365924 RepID=A0ABS4TZ78_9PSEU|nr:hypothetical protein [Kibdelosporangium banguiense]MBP2329710.1 hypothetical protein [Kibdelosporangium banguiense]
MLTRVGVLVAGVLTASVAITAPDIAEPHACTWSVQAASLTGLPAVWLDNTLHSGTPLPKDVYVIGDHDTVLGITSSSGAVRWTCS